MASDKKPVVKEPLIHITKRAHMAPAKSLGIRALSILAALVVSGLVALALIEKLQDNPGRLLEFYECFIRGSFATPEMFWKFLKNLSVLLCIALALTPAFRMHFWNIGAEGQVLVSILGAVAVMFYAKDAFPGWLLLILMLGAAILCGIIWALIPAIFKAFFNTNETLFTLMLNYVATFLVSYFLLLWVPVGTSLGILNLDTKLGWLPTIVNNYFLIILIVLCLTGVIHVYLNYSKHGYEISVVGESMNTARYIGINVKKVIIRTMILSGALCGVAGFLIAAGLNHSITTEAVGGQGFTAILVAWMAKFNPLIMIGTSGLVIFLNMGAEQIAETFNVRGSMPDIIIGIILFFIIGSEFFINYKVHFRKKPKKEESPVAVPAAAEAPAPEKEETPKGEEETK